jgi:NAD-dependent deacetylase
MNATLTKIIERGGNLVFFGGAGVSTESGIPDFRSADGLYSADSELAYTPEQIISHSFFVRHTAEFYDYYVRHLVYPDARPNNAHKALANLEADGRLKAVVTQNIDGLHQDAGSKTVHELHGSVRRNICTACGARYGLEKVLHADGVPRCDSCGGLVKPDVVLYEEPLDARVMEAAVAAVRHADTLIVGGSSLVVYPAAGLIDFFNGDELVLINKEPTGADSRATCVVRDPIGQALTPWA